MKRFIVSRFVPEYTAKLFARFSISFKEASPTAGQFMSERAPPEGRRDFYRNNIRTIYTVHTPAQLPTVNKVQVLQH